MDERVSKLDARYKRCGQNADMIDVAWWCGPSQGGPHRVVGDLYIMQRDDDPVETFELIRRTAPYGDGEPEDGEFYEVILRGDVDAVIGAARLAVSVSLFEIFQVGQADKRFWSEYRAPTFLSLFRASAIDSGMVRRGVGWADAVLAEMASTLRIRKVVNDHCFYLAEKAKREKDKARETIEALYQDAVIDAITPHLSEVDLDTEDIAMTAFMELVDDPGF